MTDNVIKDLSRESGAESPFHEQMLREAKALVKRSRAKMSSFYAEWDHQDQVFRGEKYPDNDDKKQELKGKPIKMVVPNTFAQVMTFASSLFLLFRQNPRFFELTSKGGKDYGQKKDDCEVLLERDLQYNGLSRLLFQNLVDTGRFGPGILEVSWTRKLSRINVPTQQVVTQVSGVETVSHPGTEWQDVVKYEGNLVRNVSPYRWFPDTNFPICDFMKGEFCAAEEEYSLSALQELEAAGEVAGVDHITALTSEIMRERGTSRLSFELDTSYQRLWSNRNDSAPVVVTKMQRWITPSKYKIAGEGEKVLGPETHPVLYHVWYANDNRLIRCEPCMWWHNEFSWAVGEFTPDMHRTLSLGLADLIYRLQDVISWFVNSHITSVRRVMNNRLIIHPMLVETKTLDGEGDIYIRKGVGTSLPPERAVGQLKVQDVTGAHMSDMQVLSQLMQIVTGVNDNAMGQYNSGRRSATEARVVTSGAAGRLKMHAHLIWDTCWSRVGKLMLSNLRQGLSQEEFDYQFDTQGDPTRYAAFAGTPQEVARGTDFLVFDSTLASEKGYMAQSLSDLFQVILSSSPMAAQRIGMAFDPMKMLDEIQRLRGSGEVSRFMLSPEEQQQQAQMWAQQAMLDQQNANAGTGTAS